MKNAIKYYYNLEVVTIRQKDKQFNFESNQENYILTKYNNEDINNIYELNKQLLTNNIKSHIIILNSTKQLITNINGEMYVLLKLIENNSKFEINDIINLNNIQINNDKLNMTNWFDLWTKKVDYFEYQISQIGKKYPLVTASFSYYIGLAENAIWLIKGISKENLYISLSHRRLNYEDTTFELYNPFNYIIDYRIRDVCEYLKSCFFANFDIREYVYSYMINLSNEEKKLFFIRMLFPTYYFDCYEKIINNQIDENNLNNITSKVKEYEGLLKYLYSLVPSLPKIEWLAKY